MIYIYTKLKNEYKIFFILFMTILLKIKIIFVFKKFYFVYFKLLLLKIIFIYKI